MSDSKSQTPQAPPPRRPPAAKHSKARPAIRADERLIGRSILRSGAPPKR